MAKKEKAGLAEGVSGGNTNPEASKAMADFLASSGLAEQFSAGERATLNIWNPAEGAIRAFKYMGMETKESTTGEFAGSEFDVHYGVDLKTGEDFSFIGGGLFSWAVRERKIEKGTPLIARYIGIVSIDEGRRQAKQWEIRLLNSK